MAQRRMLSKRISQSKKVNSLSVKSQLIWTWIIPWLDDYGCYTADPEDIKTEVFPKNKKILTKDIQKALWECAEIGLIILYKFRLESSGFQKYTGFYQQYNNFEDFQTFKSDRGRKSDYPRYQAENEDVIPLGNHWKPLDSLNLSKDNLSKDNNPPISPLKKKYLEFVMLTEDEHKKLIDKFGQQATDDKIQNLNDAIGSKGYKYKSHYHTILNWDRRDKAKETNAGKTKLYPIKPTRSCGVDGCSMPAVHKVVGEFDHYYCWEHIPTKIKSQMQEKYYA